MSSPEPPSSDRPPLLPVSSDAREEATPATMKVEEEEDDDPSTTKASDRDSNHAAVSDSAAVLEGLGATLQNQDEIERNVHRQANELLIQQENERDEKRLAKTRNEQRKQRTQLEKLESRARSLQASGVGLSTRLQMDLTTARSLVESLDQDLRDIEKRMRSRAVELGQADVSKPVSSHRLPHESQRDFLIRTGKITPFARVAGENLSHNPDNLRDALLHEEAEPQQYEVQADGIAPDAARSHRMLTRPGFASASTPALSSDSASTAEPRARKRRRVESGEEKRFTPTKNARAVDSRADANATESSDDTDAYKTESSAEKAMLDEDEAHSDTGSNDSAILSSTAPHRKGRAGRKAQDDCGLDDGNEPLYQRRLQKWVDSRARARHKAQRNKSGTSASAAEDSDIARPSTDYTSQTAAPSAEEWTLPHPSIPDTEIGPGYRIPGDIYPALFDYQKTGVQWLWELYSKQVGGIVGDEMGLGKTIQVISFLAGLHYSGKLSRPVIVVAPATVMSQWVNEFHTWWPPFRVSILHTSGSGMMDVGREVRREDDLLLMQPGERRPVNSKAQAAARKIVDRVVEHGHVLVTTYSGLQTYANLLVPIQWEYAVLDEGHKIRNPNAGITLFAKELRTPNRIILSGTPMQNNLVELWSLFDFIFPMRLGNLLDFKAQFEIPIRIGGYANATNVQIQTANKCAETLKDAISPYLLQRLKADVAADLPQKTERVLFCKLTKPQRVAYEEFLASNDMHSIAEGRRQVLAGVDILRKICNHPDLVEHRTLSQRAGYAYGAGNKSGKMVVTKELLQVWKASGHKTLLFAQHRIMLDILEKYVKDIPGMRYRRMDGNTSIAARQALVDEFNNDPSLHVFLLTTKVGGLGVNLTGADRVIIFDPDWNPSTDVQARERAWRLGQKRAVEIYRLMVAGTIEEKIFHRQVFKQFLSNKILRDPKQRQTFQMQDLHDLFTLGDANEESTETSKLFQGSEVTFKNGPEVNGSTNITDSPLNGETAKVRDLAGVSSLEDVPTDAEPTVNPDQSQSESSTTAKGSDQRLLEGIFARTGVHSALEHDQIVNGRRVVTADPQAVDREARRIAAEAAAELRKAEAVARTVPAGVPTWTGQFGVAGRPGITTRPGTTARGPSSRGILAGLQASSGPTSASDSPATSSPGTSTGSSSQAGASGYGRRRREMLEKDFVRQIRDFLAAHGGRAYTQNLIDQFQRHCRTAERTATFKHMLREVATLERGTRGRGQWVLKEEFGGLH